MQHCGARAGRESSLQGGGSGNQPGRTVRTDSPLSQAVVAAACFPIGLPPFVLDIEKVPSGTRCPSSFTEPGSIYLSDGGVLENLGVRMLLRSSRFRSWDIVQSDAAALVLMGRPPSTAIGRRDAGLVYWVNGHSNESWIS